MSKLLDYPEWTRKSGNWYGLDKERGVMIKYASRHLSAFAQWYEKSRWFGKTLAENAALFWCNETGLRWEKPYANRWAFQQMLGQMYEQHALNQINGMVPTDRPDKPLFFFIPRRTKKKARAPSPALA